MKTTRQRAAVMCAVLAWLAATVCPVAAEASLRSTLEKAWESHLQASRSGMATELEKTMSSFRLGMMKNNLASAKRSLTPEMIRTVAEYAPDISASRFVTLLENGPTAGLVYVKDSDDVDATGKPRVTFTFIKFVKEGSGWRVDGAADIGSPKFRDNGEPAEFDPSDLPSTYEIDGKVPGAPAPVAASEFSAFLDVFCPGYKTQVTVNGVEQATTVNQSHSGLLAGGLRKGTNSIVIVVSRIQQDASFEPMVTIRRIREDRSAEEVFKFEPQENVEGTHTAIFTVRE